MLHYYPVVDLKLKSRTYIPAEVKERKRIWKVREERLPCSRPTMYVELEEQYINQGQSTPTRLLHYYSRERPRG